MKKGMKAMHGDHNMHAKQAPARHDKAGHWDGGSGLGTGGKRWEGTGKECRGKAASVGFGKK